MDKSAFINNTKNLMQLSKRQKSVRLLIQGLWMGLAGFNFIWAIDLLLGFDLHWSIKLGFGVICAGYSITKAIIAKTDIEQYVWHVDRNLKTKEQISTAWMISKGDAPTYLNEALLDDANQITSELMQQIKQYGWYLKKGFKLLSLMLLLLGVILISGGQAQYKTYPASQAALLPPIKADPGIEEIFAGGVPGMEGEPGGGGEQDGEQGSTGTNAISESFQETGSALSESAETQDLGEAPKNGDLKKAAQELEALADNFDNLSEETKENLAQTMKSSSESTEKLGMQDMAEQFNQAAEAIEESAGAEQGSPANQQAQKEMQAVAQSMDELSEQLDMMSLFGKDQTSGQQSGSGSGAGDGSPTETNSGEPEPVERLQGEGETMKLQTGEGSNSGLLDPSPPVGTGTVTAHGSFGLVRHQEGTSSAVLAPYTYPLEWQTVISTYFLHSE